LLEFISNSKSGQFFFYSHDGQFLIKSMTRSESLFLRKILPPYYHYVQGQPNTLITRFYGMYRVKVPGRKEIYFVVMGSVFHSSLEIHRIYDLKGSTHGRRATEKDREQAVPVLKDLDFVEDRQLLRIGKKQAKLFKDQLRKDVELLRKMNIMDYSLLVGIHYRDRGEKEKAEERENKKDNQNKSQIQVESMPINNNDNMTLSVSTTTTKTTINESNVSENPTLPLSSTPQTPSESDSLSQDWYEEEHHQNKPTQDTHTAPSGPMEWPAQKSHENEIKTATLDVKSDTNNTTSAETQNPQSANENDASKNSVNNTLTVTITEAVSDAKTNDNTMEEKKDEEKKDEEKKEEEEKKRGIKITNT